MKKGVNPKIHVNERDYGQAVPHHCDDPEKAKLVKKLALMITDNIPRKLFGMHENDMDFWILDKLLTKEEVKFMLSFEKRRVGYTTAELAEKNGRAAEETQKMIDRLTGIGILEQNRDNADHHIQYWIRTALERERIPFSFISTTEDGQRATYSNSNGVVISSIDSSLGLDFRAVVLTGLYPYTFVFDGNGHRHKLSGWNSIKSLPDEAKEAAQIQMRKLYTACSRAREVLYVLSDAEDETIIDDIIRNGVKRK